MELVGRQFGHLRVTEAIGQGGMGDVYAAWDEKLERKVALKVLNADQRLDEESRGRLLREARSLSKLDHSNICRIHDYIEGADDGEVDLLVLEFIDGETLHEALEKGPMSRAEKLRIAIKVAEVLIDAHREGIVHRDLKPDNVMLTKSGEVKVLDFGLARWFKKGASQPRIVAEPASTPAHQIEDNYRLGDTLELDAAWNRRTPTGRREFQGTAIGITLGTPIYMSPEQARGENLTPASDMFSFGLLLQTLFTGKDPHPIDITAREVILRVARGETLPVENASRDVTTLINRLKRFAPADRPTAVETLERLQFFADKPQRIIRRSIAAAVALVLLIGAWRYMVDLRRERAIAIAERAEAQQRRAQVEDLLEFMLGDLRKKLEPVGRLDILDDVGERALAHVASLDPQKMNPEELTRNAKALHQLVQVRIAQGKLPDALHLARRARQLTELAIRRAPAQPDVKLQHAFSQFWIGSVLFWQSDLKAAVEPMKAYAILTDELAREYPTNEAYLMERAHGHNGVAKILERSGDLEDAMVHYTVTLGIKEKLAAEKPDDRERQSALATTLNNIGYTLLKLGRFAPARDHFARELAIYEKLTADEPDNKIWQHQLATSHSYNAAAFGAVGDVSAAMGHVQRQVDIRTRLHAHDPENARWTGDLASGYLHMAWLERLSDPAASRAHTVTAERLIRPLVADDRSGTSARRKLAMILVARARAELRLGLLRNANDTLDSAATTLGPGGDAPTREIAADIDRARGALFVAQRRSADAMRAWSAAAEKYAALPNLKDEPAVQAAFITVLLRLGRHTDAQPYIDRLNRIGYRQSDYVEELAVLGK